MHDFIAGYAASTLYTLCAPRLLATGLKSCSLGEGDTARHEQLYRPSRVVLVVKVVVRVVLVVRLVVQHDVPSALHLEWSEKQQASSPFCSNIVLLVVLHTHVLCSSR